MKTNKILVVGAMVVGCLVATGCSDAKDADAQEDGTTQGVGTESAHRFGGFHGRAGRGFGHGRVGHGGFWGRARRWFR